MENTVGEQIVAPHQPSPRLRLRALPRMEGTLRASEQLEGLT
jgi:hypothetical protein